MAEKDIKTETSAVKKDLLSVRPLILAALFATTIMVGIFFNKAEALTDQKLEVGQVQIEESIKKTPLNQSSSTQRKNCKEHAGKL